MAAITPEPIMKVALGFMAAKHLFVANEIGLFEHLADKPASLDELAERTGTPQRTTRIIADAMVSLGFLDKEDGRYRNSDVAATFLSGNMSDGLRAALRFLNRMRYPRWHDLETAVRTGGGHTTWGKMTEDEQRIVSEGIAAWTAPVANALASAYDFGRHHHVLDLAGGTGEFLIAALSRHPGLAGTIFELPDTAAVARRALAGKPEASRVNVVAGDLFKDALAQDADAVVIANVMHLFLPNKNVDMLQRVRRHVAPGARLLLVDFWTNPAHTEPLPASLMAGEFLLFAGDGDVYSAEDANDWLTQTGWHVIEQKPLAGPVSLIVAEAAA